MLINIFDTAIASVAVPNANCEPPLNPNQPSHKINTPIVTNGIDDAAKGLSAAASPFLVNRPSLGPKIIAPASAAAPPVECTNVEPAKSEKPIQLTSLHPIANP